MAAGEIHRTGDSGAQAGEITGTPASVRLHTSHVHALTAVQDSVENLKLISWRINQNGSINRLQDSGNQAGKVSDLSLTQVFSTFHRYVTAVMDGSGDEKLISWNVNEDGSVVRMADSGSDGRNDINGVSAVGRDGHHNLVTGVWDGQKRLKLETWRMNQNGQFTRIKDSGNQAGEVQTAPTLLALKNGLVLSVVVTKEGTLKLISWRIDDDGSIERLKDSGTQAGIVKALPVAVEAANGIVVTAVSDSSLRLKLISWQVSQNGTISRRGDSGAQAGQIRGLGHSIARSGSVYVTAVPDSDSNLKLISWSVSPDGKTIDRRGDSGDQAGKINAGLVVHTAQHSASGFVTSIATSGNNLKLISWTVDPF